VHRRAGAGFSARLVRRVRQVDAAVRAPVPTADGRGLTYEDAVQGVSTALFAESQWGMITQGLAELSAGRGEVLLGMRDAAVEAWPEPPRNLPWLTGDVDVPPTLTVSVTGDPGTPHQGGINMARLLGGSLVTVEGAQYGVALFGQSECVDEIVTDYLIDLQAPPDDARRTL
jgi:hypothetical protein